MICLSITELPRIERQDAAIREAVRATGKRLRSDAYDREVAVQCALNAWRTGSSPAAAVERGTRYLRAAHGHTPGGVA